MDVIDFSDLPLDFLEDNYSREVVSKSLLDRAEARAKTLDWKNIPKDRCTYFTPGVAQLDRRSGC